MLCMSGLGTDNSDILAMIQRAQNNALRIINFQEERHQVHFYTLRQRYLNFIIALNNCMLFFDHLNSSLSTIFDDLFKPFNEKHSHNTRGASRYVSNILTKMKTVKRGYFDQQGYFDHLQIL